MSKNGARRLSFVVGLILSMACVQAAQGQMLVSTGAASGLRIYQLNSNDWWLDPAAGRLDIRANGVLVSSVGVDGSMWVSGGITVPAPTQSNQVATKAYVDAASGGASTAQVGSLSPNIGMYANQIPSMTPPAAYTEICFKSGATSFDAHSVSESTAGGNCVPGDIGYILEQNVRTTKTWELAKEICTQNNMRLPEVFELKLACKNQATWSLTSIGDGNEWSSNQTFSHWQPNSSYDTAVPVMQASCAQITLGNVGHSSNSEDSNPYRCAR